MFRHPVSSFNLPNLTRLPDERYNLGVPVEEGTLLQVGTSEIPEPIKSRLSVVKLDGQVNIERVDGVPIQAVAKDHFRGGQIAPIFGEPIDRLIVVREAKKGRGRRSDMWTPMNEGLSITNEVGFHKFLFTVAMYAQSKGPESKNPE